MDPSSLPKPIKWYKNLATRKGRLEAEVFLIEGDRAIKQIISSNPDEIIEIVSIEELSPFYHKYSKRLVTDSQLRSICSSVETLPSWFIALRCPNLPMFITNTGFTMDAYRITEREGIITKNGNQIAPDLSYPPKMLK